MNSFGSESSCCHSSILASHCSSACSSALRLGVPPLSLYRQCAAIPNSAVACIWFVRIWTSRGLPSGPITVVCRDWYMLNLGIAT